MSGFDRLCITVREDQREEMKKYPENYSGWFQIFLDMLLKNLAIAKEKTEREFLEKIDDKRDDNAQ